MKIKTVDELRAAFVAKTPLFAVVYLCYLDTDLCRSRIPIRGNRWGRDEDIYTTLDEAEARYNEIAVPSNVEDAALRKNIYPPDGSRPWITIKTFNDPDGRSSE